MIAGASLSLRLCFFLVVEIQFPVLFSGAIFGGRDSISGANFCGRDSISGAKISGREVMDCVFFWC